MIENAGEGIDTVYATAHFRLSPHVENLVLQGSADLQAYGNGASNAIYGNAGTCWTAGPALTGCMALPAMMSISSTIPATP